MVKTAFLSEEKVQDILGIWQLKQSTIQNNLRLKDNPIIRKQLTLFVSSIASSGYSIDYSLKLNIKETINELNSLLESENIPPLSYDEKKNKYPTITEINNIIETIGMRNNRKAIISKQTDYKKLLSTNNKILSIINDFMNSIEVETVIELVLKDLYLIGASFWYINTDENISLDYINFSDIQPRFRKKGKFFVIDGWDITNNGEIVQSLSMEEVLVFNNLSTIEYAGMGVIESIYEITDIIDEDLQDLRTQRRTRAGVKLFHYPSLETVGRRTPLTEEEMREYKKINKQSRTKVNTDYYSNGLWKIDVLKADDTIDNVNDIELIKEVQETGLIIPHGLIDSGSNINRSTLDVQIAYYVTVAYTIANDISSKLTYLINSYIPDSIIRKNKVKITWNYTEPQSLLDKAKMMAYLKNQFIQIPMYKLVTDIMRWDWDSFLNAVKKDEEYIKIVKSLPDMAKQVQAPGKAVDPKNSHNNLKKDDK